MEENSLEADVARTRAVLTYNNVGFSIDNETLKEMLAVHIHEEHRVDLVILELEEAIGIALTDPTQVQNWQEHSTSLYSFPADLTPERAAYAPNQFHHDQPQSIENPNDVQMDIILDRETLLLRKEYTTLTYNEIYIFLRAHRDETERLQLARNYFEQEKKRMETERGGSPPPPLFQFNPSEGTKPFQVKTDLLPQFESPEVCNEFKKKDSVVGAGPSRLVARVLAKDTSNGGFSVSLLKPRLATAMNDNLNDVLLMISDEDHNDPTLDWDFRELSQILPDVPEAKVRSCLWHYRQREDRVRLVINHLLDNERELQTATSTGNPQNINFKNVLEAEERPLKAKRMKKSEVSSRTEDGDSSSAKAVNGMKPDSKVPEEPRAVATSSKISNGPKALVLVKKKAVNGILKTTDNNNVLTRGAQPDTVRRRKVNDSRLTSNHGASKKEKSVDTNPAAKNSTRAPAKGKALVKPAKPNSPPTESTNISIVSNDEHLDEEDENLCDAKIERAKTLYRLITQEFPTVHVLYAAHQAAELVERGWNDEQHTNPKLLVNNLRSGFPTLHEEWLVPKSEPGAKNATNITCLRQTLLNKVVEEQVASAVQIFPNVDPEYLEAEISALNGCELRVQGFVASVLENPNSRPTIAEFHKRQRTEELTKKVWSAEDFLENYEDPIGYFYDPKRNLNLSAELEAKYLSEVKFYLRKEFPLAYERDIQRAITQHRGNTVLMCNSLRTNNLPKRKVQRRQSELNKVGSFTSPRLIEELNFLRVEHEIRKILEEKQEARNQALLEARQNNQFLECTICCENELIAMDFISCPAKHMFCKSCVRRHVEEIMGMVKCHFPCLDPSCDKEFQPQEFQVVLKSQVFKRLMRRLQAEEIACANIDGLEMCPFCDFAAIPPEGDKVFQCLNPECSKASCRLCQEEAHIPLSCQELITSKKLDKLRTYMEDKMTEALLRECPRCQKKYVKSDGCNKIVCPCGALSCYICRKEVKDYSHFDGQGSYTGKCPLWTNTEAMHQQEVHEQARRTRQELKQRNPGVRFDQVLPNIPAPVAPARLQTEPINNLLLHLPNLLQPGRPGAEQVQMVRGFRNPNVRNGFGP